MGYEENVTSFLLSGIESSFCYFYILLDNGKLKEHVSGPIVSFRPKTHLCVYLGIKSFSIYFQPFKTNDFIIRTNK